MSSDLIDRAALWTPIVDEVIHELGLHVAGDPRVAVVIVGEQVVMDRDAVDVLSQISMAALWAPLLSPGSTP